MSDTHSPSRPNLSYIDKISPNSITPTLRQSPGQVRDKVENLSPTQIMKVRDTNHVADFHDFCPR